MPVIVEFAAPADVVYAHLADPSNRPGWQASLRRVEDVSGDGGPGTTWTDVTAVGARPKMEVTHTDPGRAWAETGRWHGIEATLRLDFQQVAPDRTTVRATIGVATPLVLLPVGLALRALAPLGVRSDLRRAARALATVAR